MSGGSLDYLYSKVDDAADRIDGSSPLYSAFAAHLRKVSKALHDVEWVLSCDYSHGQEEESVRAVLAKGAELTAAVEMAERVRGLLDAAIAQAKGAAS